MDEIPPAAFLRRRVYLLHFYDPATQTSQGYKHAKHYLGMSDDVSARNAAHHNGKGARLLQVVKDAGLSWVVARTWRGGRMLEYQLKSRHNAPKELCPICQGKITLAEVLAVQPAPSTRIVGRRAPMTTRSLY